MRVFATLAIAALACAAPSLASAAQEPPAAQEPSQPAAIVAAVQSCLSAITEGVLDESRLIAGEWKSGRPQAEGKAVDTPLRFFTRGPILLIAGPQGANLALMARVNSADDQTQVVRQLTAILGKPSRKSNSSALWIAAGGRLIEAGSAGTADSPSIRIMIIHPDRKTQ